MEYIKNVLLVEDDRGVLGFYGVIFSAYAVKSVFYEDSPDFPKENFDLLIVDGLEGKCWDVISKVSANKKVICSSDSALIPRAKEEGVIFLQKPAMNKDLLSLLEDFKK